MGGAPTYVLGYRTPFAWLRVDATETVTCARCGRAAERTVPVLVDWLDRTSVADQAGAASGSSCPACGAAVPAGLPLLQYRTGDVVGLLMGFPAESDPDDDRRVIGEVLAVAQSDGGPSRVEGARSLVAVRLAWWGDVCRRPLGPALVGAEHLPIPESAEEQARWLADTVAALDLPPIASPLADYLEAPDAEAAVEVVRRHPVLVDPRWQVTVQALARMVRADMPDDDALSVTSRVATLRSIAQLGPTGYVPAELTGPLGRQAAAAHAADPAERPALVAALVEALDEAEPTPFTTSLYGSATYMLLTVETRSPADHELLAIVADKAVAAAEAVHGRASGPYWAACLNLAVVIEEQPDGDGGENIARAARILDAIAAPAARAGHSIVADIATNHVSLATMRTGRRGDATETATRLAADARHIADLLRPDDRRSQLASMVDEAATLRARMTGGRLAGAQRAVELLATAQEIDAETPTLTPSEAALVAGNLANALFQQWELAPDTVDPEAVVAACDAAVERAGSLDRLHQVAIDVVANCGSVLTQLHVAAVQAGRPDPDLWARARDLLEDAHRRSSERHPAGAPQRLRAAVNLAAVYGTTPDGRQPADPERAARLMEEVIGTDPDPTSDFTLAAATNLGQLRIGQGRWSEAADAYAVARAAQVAQIRGARTTESRLAEIVKTADLASRRALALARADRWDEVPSAIEEARGRLVDRKPPSGPSEARADGAGDGSDGVAIAHLATCDYGTVGLVQRPDGRPFGFTTPLTAGVLKPLVNDLVLAATKTARRAAFDRLAAHVADIVEATAAILRASDEPVGRLRIVTGGPLSACPLHAVGDATGRPLVADWPVEYATTGPAPGPGTVASPTHPVAISDPGGDLPFARSEVEAVARYGADLRTAPEGWSRRAWLLSELPRADLLHLATHAEADLDDPMRSRFDLGDDEELTAGDLAGLSTPHLALVVAPACQAATSSPAAPDELLGVAHALLYAGAGTVVSSLWDAADRVTALLVSAFYRELAIDPHPGTALARAQRLVRTITGPELAALCAARRAGDDDAAWLPRELADEMAALAAHPRLTDGTRPCFDHPADWAHLSCLTR